MHVKLLHVIRHVLKYGVLVVLLLIFLAHSLVRHASEERLFRGDDPVPRHETALLLGTSRYMRSGRTNQFFANRMAAAAYLVDSGAVSHIVASGDNRFENYNEPRDMAEVLTTLGVPESRITRDGHGLRTIDSVLRMREVHGHEQFIIVSQQFHVERALFIADAFGIDAIGYAADDVGGIANVSVRLREYAARVMALFDVYVRYRGGIEFAD